MTEEPCNPACAPGKGSLGRERAQKKRLVGGELVGRELDLVVVKGGNLFRAHPRGAEPTRNMDIAEPLHVGEHLVAAGPSGGTGGGERVADEDDPGLPVSLADVEIDRTDFDVADLDSARQPPQARHEVEQG